EEAPRPRIEGRLPQHLWHHLAKALEARDLRMGAAGFPDDLFLLLFVERPVGFLADVDAVERRLREVDASGGDQLRQVTVDERQEQRRDVMTVRVRVGEDDD